MPVALVYSKHSSTSKRFEAPIPDRKQIETKLAELDRIKMPDNRVKIVPWLIVSVIVAGFAIGFGKSPQLGWELVMEWVVINGGLSAFGAVLAAVHPLTVLVAFLVAPITSLNPAIGVGVVTGATEILLRKPQVGDFSRLRSDTARLKGWWKNRVARTLMIFSFSSLGAAAGTYIAGFRIFEKLTLG